MPRPDALPRIPPRHARLLLAAAATGVAAAACGGGDGAPAPIVPTRIAFAAHLDSAIVGDTAALGATTTDDAGRSATTGAIAYTSSDTTVARVNAAGIVHFIAAGSAIVTARVSGLPNGATLSLATPTLVSLTAAARVRALPTRVDAAPGERVPLSAAVYDSTGNRIPYPVAYASDNPAVATVAGAALAAGTAGSAQIAVHATFRGRGASATIPVTIAALAPGAFHIDLVPIGTVDPAYAAVFTRAAAFWQTVITTALPSTTLDVPAGTCGDGTRAVASGATGLTIFFSVDSIDGKGNILGAAGPCVLRSDATAQQRGLPLVGSMVFDSADFAGLVAAGTAYDVIRHEMAHVLGVGTIWNVTGVRTFLTNDGTLDPQYVGPLGESGSATLGFTLDGVAVPVENTGGAGTAGAHWRSSVYRSELMTGYLAHTDSHPASRLTLLSLADLGYMVNVAASEPLLPPSAFELARVLGPAAARIPGTGFTDVALPPLYRLGSDGLMRRLGGVPLRTATLRIR